MKTVTSSELKDLKSRKVLTELLEEQVDLNEDVICENKTLSHQQKQLLLLLENKDTMLKQYQQKVQVGKNMQNYLYERSLKFCILDSIHYRLQFKLMKCAFDQVLLKAVNKRADSMKLQSFFSTYHALSKKRFLKALSKLRLKRLLSGFFEENNQQRARTGALVIHLMIQSRHKLSLRHAYSALLTKSIQAEHLAKQIETPCREQKSTVEKLTIEVSTNTGSFDSIDGKRGLLVAITLQKVAMRVMLGAWREVRLKPIQKVANKFPHLKNMTKKFLAISSIFNLMRRMQLVNYSRALQNLQEHNMKKAFRSETQSTHLKQLTKHISKYHGRQVFQRLIGFTSNIQALERFCTLNQILDARRAFGQWKSQINHAEARLFSALADITNLSHPKRDLTTKQSGKAVSAKKSGWGNARINTLSEKSIPVPSRLRKYSKLNAPVVNAKSRYHILLTKYKRNVNSYSLQMRACATQMKTKIRSFEQLNQSLLDKAKTSQQKLEEYQSNASQEVTQKELKYRHYVEELESKLRQIQNASCNQNSLNTALKNKMNIAASQIGEYERKIASLTNTIDELAQDKGDLMEKCEELINNLGVLRKEFQKAKEELNQAYSVSDSLHQELDDTTKAYDKLKGQYSIIEAEIGEIRRLTEKKGFTTSQNERSKKDISGVKDSIKKLRCEKAEVEEELDNASKIINRLKHTNTELTKETMTLNEEKIHLKNQMSRLQESNQSLKRDFIQLEDKVKFLTKSLEEKKSLLASKIINDKATPDYINQILDEKKVKENENAMLRAKVAKMNELLSSYDSKHTRQSDEVQQSQMELHELREDRKSQRKEVKDLNETVASLNRDKVNLLREMSLIHDEKENFETENKKYKQLVDEMQNEIVNYQGQMELYAKVLKTMEGKMARIDSKTKMIVKAPLNETASTDIDPDDQELFNKLKHIRRQFDTTAESDGL